MKYLATAWYWLVFLATSPFEFALGMLVLGATAPFDPDRHALHAFITGWTFQYLRCVPGWSVKVTGSQHLPKGPCVLVANHQSMADVLAAMGLRKRFKFVSKASLFRIPVVGWMMTLCRYIPLERGKPKSMHWMMDQCRYWLRRDTSVLLFPEGTYSETERMLPFRRGAFALAIEEQVPLVPVALSGTTQVIKGDGPWMTAPAHVRVTVLPPIGVGSLGTDPDALALRVRRQLAQALDRPAD